MVPNMTEEQRMAVLLIVGPPPNPIHSSEGFSAWLQWRVQVRKAVFDLGLVSDESSAIDEMRHFSDWCRFRRINMWMAQQVTEDETSIDA